MQFMDTVGIILPLTDNSGRQLYYTNLTRQSCIAFGGYTLSKCEGGYLANDGETLMTDQSTRLELSFGELTLPMVQNIQDYMEFLFSNGGQESIFVSYNGKPLYVASLEEGVAFLDWLAIEKNFAYGKEAVTTKKD